MVEVDNDVFAVEPNYNNILEVVRALLKISNLTSKPVHLLCDFITPRSSETSKKFFEETDGAIAALLLNGEFSGLVVHRLQDQERIVLRYQGAKCEIESAEDWV